MSISPIPVGYHAVTPWIIVRGAVELLEYLKEAFGAKETDRVYNEDGTIGHAEVQIGDSVVMLFDARDEWPPTPAFLRLYVEDGDTVHRRALEAGGTSVTEMTELSFGDKVGRVRDPAGNIWWIQTRLEEIEPEEAIRRAQEPTYVNAMQEVQESLARELRSRASK